MVKIKKNKEIPSIPRCKLILKKGNQNSFETYWKEPTDLSKNNHKNNEKLKVKLAQNSDTCFNNILFCEGISNKTKIPTKGINNKKFNILCKSSNIIKDEF